MPANPQLVPVDVEDVLAQIRAGIERNSRSSDPGTPVLFHPPSACDRVPEVDSNAFSFSEEQYLLANPDVASAVKQGQFKSGYDHWVRAGMYEGRIPSAARKTAIWNLLASLNALNSPLQTAARDIGEAPPSPKTIRGRIGFILISFLRRAMWWYTHSLSAFAETIQKRSRREVEILEQLAKAMAENQTAILALAELHSRSDQGIAIIAADLKRVSAQVSRISTALDQLSGRVVQTEEGTIALAREHEQLGERLSQSTGVARLQIAELESKLGALQNDVVQIDRDLRSGLTAEMHARERVGEQLIHVSEQAAKSDSRTEDLGSYSCQTRAELAVQSRRISILVSEVRKMLCTGSGKELLENCVRDDRRSVDALYFSFQEAFRGPRDLIRTRQSVYLPMLKAARVGDSQTPILDLGCGRGEWLELLRENQLTGRGVDCNQTMLDNCRALGLEVTEADALDYIQSIPGNSLGAITCFHMIEHLPFEAVIVLLDESIRILKPGGLLILETPNPSNVSVGSNTFYLDPTHVKPLPSQMLRFIVEARGFCSPEILELHPAASLVLPEEGNPAAKRLNQLFCGPQDYAVIARRP